MVLEFFSGSPDLIPKMKKHPCGKCEIQVKNSSLAAFFFWQIGWWRYTSGATCISCIYLLRMKGPISSFATCVYITKIGLKIFQKIYFLFTNDFLLLLICHLMKNNLRTFRQNLAYFLCRQDLILAPLISSQNSICLCRRATQWPKL